MYEWEHSLKLKKNGNAKHSSIESYTYSLNKAIGGGSAHFTSLCVCYNESQIKSSNKRQISVFHEIFGVLVKKKKEIFGV